MRDLFATFFLLAILGAYALILLSLLVWTVRSLLRRRRAPAAHKAAVEPRTSRAPQAKDDRRLVGTSEAR